MNCRVCNGPTHEIFSLGEMPLANSLLDSPDDSYNTYPLTLRLCDNCSLVQLSHTVPPAELFTDYNYFTSCSPPMIAHARRLVTQVESRIPLHAKSLVVEIGSNDGYLLQHYRGVPVLGIDPSVRAAELACSRGINTFPRFFDSKLALTLGPIADVIHANNVLAHVPDLNDFVAGLAHLLKPNGTMIVEVPYLSEMIDKTAFDAIYHEHVYYFSVTALSRLFSLHSLTLRDVDEIPTHGGSLRLWISHSGASSLNVARLHARESSLTRSLDYFLDFAARVERVKHDTRALLTDAGGAGGAPGAGATVVGFGAAAKATIFLNACGITSADLAYVVDDTPVKIGKFIPGTRIPIVPSADWLIDQPPHTLILAWNFAHEIAHRFTPAYRGEFFTWYSRGVGASA